MPQFFAAVLIIITAALAASCGSSKQGAAATPGAQTPAPATKGAAEALLSTYRNDWTSLSMPLSVKLRSPKRLSASGTLTMTRGEDITISMRMLGFELAVLYINGDSILALDKLHKYYIAESVSDLLGGFPATVGNLQDLILGHVFLLGENAVGKSDLGKFRIDSGSGDWFLAPVRQPRNVSYSFAIPDGALCIATTSAAVGSRPITCTYGEYLADTPAGSVTSSLSIKASGSKHSIEAEMELRPDKAKWNGGSSRKVTVPRGYTRIEASKLLKAIPEL